MRLRGWALALGLAARAAFAAPAGPLQPLASNGWGLTQEGAQFPLRCVELKGLLAKERKDRDLALDLARSAGFNAVSFDAPLFGEGGLSRKLGEVDAAWQVQLRELLQACGERHLYALPVLWTPQAVEAFGAAAGGGAKFYGGKEQMLWQGWLLRQLAGSDPGRLTTAAEVGLWLLWRGPWPGGGAKEGPGPEEARAMRRWLTWQSQTARKLGLRQLLGAGLWMKKDLPDKAVRSAAGGGEDTAPLDLSAIPFSPAELAAPDLQAQKAKELAMDALPPIPGAEGTPAYGEAASPWDLEGLDWEAAEGGLKGLPLPGMLDVFELTLDTEDWYRVGQRLAEAVASSSEVPVLWRQDWRNASAYERKKHLQPPEPLAGISGPWPEDEWPSQGESLWTPEPKRAALAFKSLVLSSEAGGVVLRARLNRPAELELAYGKALPLEHKVRSRQAGTDHELRLKAAPRDANFLLRLRASSAAWGGALVRTRWVRAAKPAKPAKPAPQAPRRKKPAP